MEEASRHIVEFFTDASSCDETQLEGFINEGFDVNQPLSLENGKRPLHIVAVERNAHAVQQLLDRGAKVDVRDYHGNTALHCAAREGHGEVVRLLLDREADPNLTNDEGCTILEYAVGSEHLDVTKLLLSRGADLKGHISNGSLKPSVQSQYLENWFFKQNKTVLSLAFQLENLALIGVLSEAGANVEMESPSLMFIAIEKNNIELVKLLVKEGANFYVKCFGGVPNKSALNFAISCGCYDIVEMLLSNGGREQRIARWFHRFSERNTAAEDRESLRLALVNGHLQIALLLFEKGVQLTKRFLDYTLQSVLMTNYCDVAEWLFNHGANLLDVHEKWCYNFFHRAITKGHIEMIQLTLNSGISLHFKNDKKCKTALMLLATQNQVVPLIELLLQEGANLKFSDFDGNTMLYYAIQSSDSTNIFQMFLKHGASVDDDVNTKTRTTALHLAITLQKKALFELLLLKGANVNAKDADGNTPCHLLFRYGFDSNSISCYAKPLLEKGANLFCVNDAGVMPISLAIKERSLCPFSKDIDNSVKVLLEECFKYVEEKESCIKTLLKEVITKDYTSLVKVVLNKVVEVCFWKSLLSCVVSDSQVTNNEDGIVLTNLHRAAYLGDINLLNTALQNGMSIDAMTIGSFTPLQIALYKGNTELAQLLVYNGANLTIEDKFGFLPIHVVFLLGDVNLTQLLHAKTFTPITNVVGIPLLNLATFHRSIRLAKFLLYAVGFDINTRDKENNTSLHIAVKKQDGKLVDFLLENGIDKNAQNKFGDTALHTAFKIPFYDESSSSDIPLTLLKHGIYINIANSEKNTALHLAPSTSLARWLLEKGVNDINAKNASGHSPLHKLACQSILFKESASLSLTELVILFLNHGADIGKGSNRYSLLPQLLANTRVDINKIELECKTNFISILSNEQISQIFFDLSWDKEDKLKHQRQLDLMEILLNQGFTLNTDEEYADLRYNCSLFTHVMEEENFYLFQLILKRDEKLDLKVVLSRAVKECKWNFVKIILDKIVVRPDNNYQYLANLFFPDNGKKHGLAQMFFDRMKMSDCLNISCALFIQLARAGNIAQVKILLEKGINVNSVDDQSNSALNYAIASGNKMLFHLLLAKGAEVNMPNAENETPTHIAAKQGNDEMFKMLIEKGAIVSTKDIDDNTLLHKTKSYEVAQILIDKGVPVNARNSDGRTALHWINDFSSQGIIQTEEIRDIPEIAALLVEKGAVVNVKDKNGTTPLHLAAKNNHIVTVKLLVDKGAKVDWRDNSGQNALHYAVIKSRSSVMIEYLLSEGTPTDVKDKDGKTPYSTLLTSTDAAYLCKFVFDKHLVKERLAGLPSVDDVDMTLSQEEEVACQKELNEMKQIRIDDTFVLFDILASSKKPAFLCDEYIILSIEALLSSHVMDQFPNYRGILKSAFIRLKLTLQAINSVFCKTLNESCRSLPVELWLHILRFLGVEDLYNIIESGTNSVFLLG